MSGGGGSTGGAVVQTTSPWAAYAAGNLGATAAQAAADTYSQQINNALSSLNQNYAAAVQGLQPYTQTGVQALDQLNQYMGLSPYQAQAPTAPTAPNVNDYLNQVTSAQVNDYINQNTMMQAVPNREGQDFYFPVYTGGGAYNNIPQTLKNNPSGDTQLGTGQYKNLGGIVGASTNVMSPYGQFSGNQQVMNLAKQALAQQMVNQAMPNYKNQVTQYNTDLANYNQDQQWAQQYGTPMTSDQVLNNITNQPGYQAQLNQGITAIQKSAAGSGLGGSGALLKGLMDYGQNTLGTYYGNTLQRLATIAGAGQQSATTNAQTLSNLGNNTASLYNDLGSNQADALLAAANAQSQGLTAANQNFNVIGASSGGGNGLGGLLGGIGSLASAFKPGGFL